jgi:hypothetical protein
VADGDAVGFAAGEEGTEEVEAEAAGFLLEVAGGRDGGVVEDERDAELRGQGGDEVGVRVGFGAAKVVIDVKDVGGEVEVVEEVEEADGVGATGDGDGDPAAGSEHGVTIESGLEADEYIMGHGFEAGFRARARERERDVSVRHRLTERSVKIQVGMRVDWVERYGRR